ncbi:MAG TPA: lycopene beta-cyclase CrtY [Allosphingosinicella sp.]
MSQTLVIVGGGLAGSLLALAFADRRTDVDILLVEQGETLGGNHVWSFFDSDLDPAGHTLVHPLVTQRWLDHEIAFPMRQRRLPVGYNSIRSEQLDRVVRAALSPDRIRRSQVIELASNYIRLESGERVVADGIIDARGASAFPGLDLAWQKFVGLTFRTSRPHGRSTPIIMDATVPQVDGYRFVYSLPFGDRELMIEDTYYSDSPVLDAPTIRQRVDAYLTSFVGMPGEVVAEESGVLPVVLDGSAQSLWPDDEPLPRLGVRGGFFHPTTGYTLPDAVANALLLTKQRDLSTPALHDLLRRRAVALWDERGFFRLLNRMLFRAASGPERYRVLEHFYRLPDPIVGRFYASALSRLDKIRILSGRPPVSIPRAIGAMRSGAA